MLEVRRKDDSLKTRPMTKIGLLPMHKKAHITSLVGDEANTTIERDKLLGNVACNLKKIPTLTQDLSRRSIATRGGECVHVPSQTESRSV